MWGERRRTNELSGVDRRERPEVVSRSGSGKQRPEATEKRKTGIGGEGGSGETAWL